MTVIVSFVLQKLAPACGLAESSGSEAAQAAVISVCGWDRICSGPRSHAWSLTVFCSLQFLDWGPHLLPGSWPKTTPVSHHRDLPVGQLQICQLASPEQTSKQNVEWESVPAKPRASKRGGTFAMFYSFESGYQVQSSQKGRGLPRRTSTRRWEH